jgi:hypothetical protein
MSHLSDLGFTVTMEEFQRLVMQAATEGEVLPSAHGCYVRWSPGAGIELWVQADSEKQLVGCNPHFAGAGRMRVGLIKPLGNPERPLDGGFYGWADPKDAEPESGEYPFVADAPDYDLIQERFTPLRTVEVQIAAFAHELHCFADEAAFDASQEGKPGFAAESFIPTGLFHHDIEQLEAQTTREQAQALFCGHILQAEQRTNPTTGSVFHALLVRTLGGTVDVVADPALVQDRPTVGGIVHGTFWLSGRILDLPPPKKPSLFQRNR